MLWVWLDQIQAVSWNQAPGQVYKGHLASGELSQNKALSSNILTFTDTALSFILKKHI